MRQDEFKPLRDPLTRESAELAIIDLLRSIGGDDLEGWETVLDGMLRNLRQKLTAEDVIA